MSTVVVSNIHFESTGNNRIQIEGSNVSIFEAGKPKLSFGSNNQKVFVSNTQVGAPSGAGFSYQTTNTSTVNSSLFLTRGATHPVAQYPGLYKAINKNYPYSIYQATTRTQGGTTFYVQAGLYNENDGIYLLTGNTGNIRTSTDGTTWTVRTPAITNTMSGCAYGNGVYVLAGSAGVMQRSTDTITWSPISNTSANAAANTIYHGTYAQGEFLFGTAGGTIVKSTNGLSWTRITVLANTVIRNIAFGNGVYVAVGYADAAPFTGRILTSTNTTTWTSRTPANTQYITCVAYGNGNFVAAGNNGVIQYSSDGQTWIRASRPTTGVFNSLTYSPQLDMFLGVVNTAASSSLTYSYPNVAVWRSSPWTTSNAEVVLYGNNVCVTAGGGDERIKSSTFPQNNTEFFWVSTLSGAPISGNVYTKGF